MKQKNMKPEEPIKLEMIRSELRVLIKVYFEMELELTKADQDEFKKFLERVIKEYNGKDIYEAYDFFHGVSK